MKGFRKLLTAVLTAAMVMTMGMTAFAADNSTTSTGSITISEAREGQSYSIYRIFDFASTSDKNGTYTILSTEYSGPKGVDLKVPDAVIVSGCKESDDEARKLGGVQ